MFDEIKGEIPKGRGCPPKPLKNLAILNGSGVASLPHLGEDVRKNLSSFWFGCVGIPRGLRWPCARTSQNFYM
jgi:hypothetical protein